MPAKTGMCWIIVGFPKVQHILGVHLLTHCSHSLPLFSLVPSAFHSGKNWGWESIYLFFYMSKFFCFLKSFKKAVFLCTTGFLVCFSVPHRRNIFKISEFNWLKKIILTLFVTLICWIINTPEGTLGPLLNHRAGCVSGAVYPLVAQPIIFFFQNASVKTDRGYLLWFMSRSYSNSKAQWSWLYMEQKNQV